MYIKITLTYREQFYSKKRKEKLVGSKFFGVFGLIPRERVVVSYVSV